MPDLSKICVTCGDGFVVTENHLALLQKNSPSFGGVRYDFPSPTRCFECRTKQRMAWRNERSLYSRKCALTGKPIISIYAPDLPAGQAGSPYVVYDREVWWGDGWDATTYGRDFDFSRPFFEQYAELLRVVPKAAVINIEVENCDYTNFQNESRNCYLCFGSGYMEDSQYCDWTYHAKDTYDCSFCARSELDYGNVDCAATYRCRGCTDCHDASECERCFDCRNCQNCFGCVGLRGKSYHIFNQPYSREEYSLRVAELRKPEQAARVNAEIQKLKLAHPHRATRMIQCENSTGDDLENCQNCFNCFGVKESQDCANMIDCFKMKDCLDMSRNGACELGYALIGGGYNHQVSFSFLTCFASFSTYTVECMNVKNVFGCVGLQKKEYCILNKQYTKEEYEKMVPRIIEHMKKDGEYGEFFSSKIGLFAYNESIAQDFYPLTRERALAEGFLWRDELRQAKEFKLTAPEIAFYKKEGLPTPTLHPNERYRERLARKLPRKLWDRMCTQCGAAIQTPYAPERREKVVCEKCYLKVIY